MGVTAGMLFVAELARIPRVQSGNLAISATSPCTTFTQSGRPVTPKSNEIETTGRVACGVVSRCKRFEIFGDGLSISGRAERLVDGVIVSTLICSRRRAIMASLAKITPCLWFDHQAEEAARFYTGIFKNSRIGRISRYAQDVHGKPAGSVLTVAFELEGQPFTAVNGGPVFQFTEAISLQVLCDTQEEVDHFWEKLSAGGDEKAQQCGWLKDRYGLSWQVVPRVLIDMISDSDGAKAQRATAAMLKMKKFDIAELKRAYAG
jgi:predicted 3-demethylubiquinone-9 3-methyltransferase (glyoxalase superfamily)